jgi:hypothetical protein
MINYGELYSMDDFISKKIFSDDYVLQIEDVSTSDSCLDDSRMVSKDYKYILKVFEENVKERCNCNNSPPYNIDTYHWEFSDTTQELFFYCTFGGDHQNDNYYSISIYNVNGNKEIIDEFEKIKAKFY